jgi:hypothetical protein
MCSGGPNDHLVCDTCACRKRARCGDVDGGRPFDHAGKTSDAANNRVHGFDCVIELAVVSDNTDWLTSVDGMRTADGQPTPAAGAEYGP